MTFTDLVLERYYAPNLGAADRLLRASTLPLALAAWWGGLLAGPAAVGAIATAAVFAKTAATGKCVVYHKLGWSTKG